MIALLTLLTLSTAQAADDPTFSVAIDTGMRPLGLPLTTGLLGGGLRLGAIFGPVTPFVGGSATTLSGSSSPEWTDTTTRGDITLFSGQAGVRLRVARLQAAETYVVASALLADHSGRLKLDDRGQDAVLGLGARSGLGGFLGGGADASLSNRVSLGVEAGVAYSGARGRYFERFEQEDYEEGVGGGLVWTYTHLRLTWWIGGAS